MRETFKIHDKKTTYIHENKINNSKSIEIQIYFQNKCES